MSNLSHPLYEEAVSTITTGDVDQLGALLDRAPDLVAARTGSPLDATLLHHTGFNGIDSVCSPAPLKTPEVARLLLERGAEADAIANGDARCTAMCWALSSWFTHVSCVQTGLVDAYLDGGAAIEGVLNDGAPLGHAIGFGYTRAVEHLASRGARVENLPAAAALGDMERLRGWLRPTGGFADEALEFTRGEAEETGRFSWPPPSDPDPLSLALVTAATHGRLEVVRMLLDAGADPDGSVTLDQTPLHFAAYVGHVPVVELLLERGARKDIRERQFDRTAAQWARETDEGALAARIDAV